jgi:hypothetical protein
MATSINDIGDERLIIQKLISLQKRCNIINYSQLEILLYIPLHKKVSSTHRVDRVLGFFSSRLLHPPHPHARVFPPPLVQGGDIHSLAGEGMGGSQFRRENRRCGTLGIYVLCGSTDHQCSYKKLILHYYFTKNRHVSM